MRLLTALTTIRHVHPQNNAEAKQEKKADPIGFRGNQPINSALFRTRHNTAAPSVIIAPRNPARGVLNFVVTLTTFKDTNAYPCRSIGKEMDCLQTRSDARWRVWQADWRVLLVTDL
jgi:hypothetical protein